MTVLAAIFALVRSFALAFLSSWFIYDAVQAFKKQAWWRFSMNVTFAIWELAFMVKYLVTV